MTRMPLISDIVRAQRLRWAGYVARREEESIVKTVALLQPAGTWPVGRLKKMWIDTIGEDMRMLNINVDLMEVAHDRERWRDIVVEASGLHGPRSSE